MKWVGKLTEYFEISKQELIVDWFGDKISLEIKDNQLAVDVIDKVRNKIFKSC